VSEPTINGNFGSTYLIFNIYLFILNFDVFFVLKITTLIVKTFARETFTKPKNGEII